jgi:hypothetical protein
MHILLLLKQHIRLFHEALSVVLRTDDGPSEPQGERWTMDVFLVSNSRLLVPSVLLAFS